MRPAATACVALVLALVACGKREATTKKEPPSATDAWRDIEWYPQSLVVVAAYPKWSSSPLGGFLAGVPGGAPPCVKEQEKKFLRYYSASPVHGGQQTTIVVAHHLDRDAFQECARVFAASVFQGVELDKQGDLVVLRTSEGSLYFGYRQDGERTHIVADTDRARVDLFLGGKGSLAENELLTEQIRAIEHQAGEWAWSASTVDVGTRMLGVPSTAYRLSLSGEEAKKEMTLAVAVGFASADDAGRAKRAFDDVAAGKGPPELVPLASAFKVDVVGSEIRVRGTVDQESFGALAAYVQRTSAEGLPP